VQVLEELERFCRREHPRLVGALGLYLGDVAVAEELAQEALVRAWRDWSRVRCLDSPGAWVHRVAINLATSHFRRRRAERRALQRLDAARLSREDPDVADAVAVRQALAALPSRPLPRRQRAALVLGVYLDLPAAEVAEALGVTTGAVHQLTYRGIAALRAALGPARAALVEGDGDA
jgi:RNA polymerase sigma-70 factor (ECF subfamily)